MAKKKKGTTIRGNEQTLLVRCRNCHHSKRIEVKKTGRHRHIFGAIELTREDKSA